MGQEIMEYAQNIDPLELAGLVFGLLSVWFLIKQSILTWPTGILYVFVSLVVFWRIRLYGDFILHIFFLILNVYGWYYWKKGSKKQELPVTLLSVRPNLVLAAATAIGIVLFGIFLQNIPKIWPGLQAASLPFWDSATSVMSVTGMWLTTRKKMESWYYWLAVDVLATFIYLYKGIYFYSVLYGVYVVLAGIGFLEWRKTQATNH